MAVLVVPFRLHLDRTEHRVCAVDLVFQTDLSVEQGRVEGALHSFLVVGFDLVVVASHPLVAADLEPVRLGRPARLRHPELEADAVAVERPSHLRARAGYSPRGDALAEGDAARRAPRAWWIAPVKLTCARGRGW